MVTLLPLRPLRETCMSRSCWLGGKSGTGRSVAAVGGAKLRINHSIGRFIGGRFIGGRFISGRFISGRFIGLALVLLWHALANHLQNFSRDFRFYRSDACLQGEFRKDKI